MITCRRLSSSISIQRIGGPRARGLQLTVRVSLSESESGGEAPYHWQSLDCRAAARGSLQLLGSAGSRQLMHLGTGPAQYTLWYIFYNYIADVN
jgi:hypothetical protein